MDRALVLLATPTRQHILRLLWDRELCAGDIAARCDVTFGAVSQHLRVLREAGLVEQRAAGKQRFYRADKQALGPLADMLASMWHEALTELKQQAEAEAKQARQGRAAARQQPPRKKPRRTARKKPR